MDVTLKIEGLDISDRLSTYSVMDEVTYKQVITTLDEVEHPYPGKIRQIITFSLIPGTAVEDLELYNKLKKLIVSTEFTQLDEVRTRQMRLVSNLESTFLLLSVDGKRRYKGGQITLRGL